MGKAVLDAALRHVGFGQLQKLALGTLCVKQRVLSAVMGGIRRTSVRPFYPSTTINSIGALSNRS